MAGHVGEPRRQTRSRGRATLALAVLVAALAAAVAAAPSALAGTVGAFGLGSSYKALVGTHEALTPAGWQTPAFDDSGWPTLPAPFSSTPGAVDPTCHFPAGATNFPPTGHVLVRKHVVLPADATHLHIGGTVGGEATVYVSGLQVSHTEPVLCTAGSIDVVAPDSILVAGGDNVIAVSADDASTLAYLDLSADYQSATLPVTVSVSALGTSAGFWTPTGVTLGSGQQVTVAADPAGR